LQAKQKRYPGVSGWTYTGELGFNVTDNDRDAWRNFSKAHTHFKPFATCRWIHFKMVDEIIPLLARGHYVFHGGFTQPAESATAPPEQSQDDDTEQCSDDSQQCSDDSQQRSDNSQQHSDNSQPFSDWSQTNYARLLGATSAPGPQVLNHTAGKCQGRGFMAFDRRRSDIGHGVGLALHNQSKIWQV
ncbi:hypothetical protein B0H10DRAFT_2320763, partial [Mycena sp. CBHHK59/15]